MKHGSLFSGIGGFDLAAEWMGWENKFHCEWNPFGQKVLKYYFPNAESFNDITKTDFTKYANEIDILTGGFPCQPYSQAGKRLGKADERHLFPEMLRAIKEIKPRWIIGENVRGLTNWNEGMVFHEVYDDLEREGYEVQSFLIPAASVNAPHQRYRVWFIAYSKANGCKLQQTINKWSEYKSEWDKIRFISKSDGNEWNATDSNSNGQHRSISEHEINTGEGRINAFSNIEQSIKNGDATDSISSRRREIEWKRKRESNVNDKISSPRTWEIFPTISPICNGDDGLSSRLDSITFPKWRAESIKAGGNAIVPQVALQIFKAIQEFENIINDKKDR